MMKHRQLAAALTTFASSLAWAFPAHASAGGTTLAFNGVLDTVASNIQGPTANAIATIVFVVGMITFAINKDNGLLRTVGGAVMAVVLIAKAPDLISELGLGGACTTPYSYLELAIPLAALPLLIVVTGFYLFSRRYTNDVR